MSPSHLIHHITAKLKYCCYGLKLQQTNRQDMTHQNVTQTIPHTTYVMLTIHHTHNGFHTPHNIYTTTTQGTHQTSIIHIIHHKHTPHIHYTPYLIYTIHYETMNHIPHFTHTVHQTQCTTHYTLHPKYVALYITHYTSQTIILTPNPSHRHYATHTIHHTHFICLFVVVLRPSNI